MTKSFLNALVVALAAGAAVPDPAAAACGPTTFTLIVRDNGTVGTETLVEFPIERRPAINSRGAVAFGAFGSDLLYARGDQATVPPPVSGALTLVSLQGTVNDLTAENATIASHASGADILAYVANQEPDGLGVYRWMNGTVTMIGNVDGFQTTGKGILRASPEEPPMVSDTGLVAFTAPIDSPTVWALMVGDGTTLTKVGQGSSSAAWRYPALSTNGQWVTVTANVSGFGLYRWELNGTGTGVVSGPTQIANPGVFSPSSVNNSGAVAYVLSNAVYVSTSPTALANSAGAFNTFDSYVSINNSGTVVFRATLDGGGEGLFNGPDPIANRIIGTGDPLDGSTVSAAGPALAIGARAINDAGQIVFWAKLTNGRSGIYVATPGGTDNAPPVISGCPQDLTVNTTPGQCTGTASWDAPSASDDCGVVLTSTHLPGVFPKGERTVTYTATDPTGNMETCRFKVTVNDKEPPTIATCAAPHTLSADAACTAVVPDLTSEVVATDNCTAASALVITQSPVAGSPAALGSTDVTITVKDQANNAATCTTTITVKDMAPPVIALNGPATVTLECHGTYTEQGASASDACDAALTTATVGGDVVNTAAPGTYTVTYTATDASGNAAVPAQRTVTVQDTTPPVITLNGPATVTLECHGTYTEPGASASDACDASVTATTVSGSVDAHVPGTYTLTYTAADGSGNAAVPVQRTVIVQDTTPPVITLNGLASVTLECHGTYTEQGASASDACDASVTAAAVSGSVDADVPGTYTLTYTAADASGNAAATVTRTVIVQDTTAPVISVDTTPIVVMDTDCSGGEVVSLPAATATDACAGVVPVTNNAPAMFPLGVTIVTYTATDTAGNTATAQVSVTVNGAAIISVEAVKFSVNLGPRPGLTRAPLRGITVGAYKRTPNSCVSQNVWGNPFQIWPRIFNNCAPDYTAITDNNGEAQLQVSPGDYVVVTRFDNDNDGRWEYLGSIENSVHCGDVQRCRLRLLELANGQKCGAIITRLIGSELLILEPEVITWDEPEQLYPFVFESVGDWTVTTSVTPPDGFVPDYDALSARVTNEVEAVQFTITEVGSDLLPTETRFSIQHNGRRHLVRGRVGIQLTEKYARSRGFDPVKLRQKGLIADRPARQGR